MPGVHRVGGLDVVMAVHQHRGRVGLGSAHLAVHHRVPRRGEDLDVLRANGPQVFGHPVGRALHVALVLRQGGDGWDAQESLQFGQKTVSVLFEVGDGLFAGHRHSLSVKMGRVADASGEAC